MHAIHKNAGENNIPVHIRPVLLIGRHRFSIITQQFAIHKSKIVKILPEISRQLGHHHHTQKGDARNADGNQRHIQIGLPAAPPAGAAFPLSWSAPLWRGRPLRPYRSTHGQIADRLVPVRLIVIHKGGWHGGVLRQALAALPGKAARLHKRALVIDNQLLCPPHIRLAAECVLGSHDPIPPCVTPASCGS